MQNEIDIPIFKKTYDLYKAFYSYRTDVSKQDRYTIWQRCENCIIDILEAILFAAQTSGPQKLPALESGSVKLNVLRVLVRLSKDVQAIDNQRYLALESDIDEIGRMFGGWIRSTRER